MNESSPKSGALLPLPVLLRWLKRRRRLRPLLLEALAESATLDDAGGRVY